jgi:hypothetical protein
MDSIQPRGLGFLAQRPKPIKMTQNHKWKNRRKNKRLNFAKNMMNKKDKPRNMIPKAYQITSN